MQARALRAHHLNFHYVACLVKIMTQIGVVASQVNKKYTHEDEEEASVVFYSMDDKAKVSVEEPLLAMAFY